MPILKPVKDEKQEDFISRCIGDDTMKTEDPDGKQRAAICYNQWKSNFNNHNFIETKLNDVESKTFFMKRCCLLEKQNNPDLSDEELNMACEKKYAVEVLKKPGMGGQDGGQGGQGTSGLSNSKWGVRHLYTFDMVNDGIMQYIEDSPRIDLQASTSKDDNVHKAVALIGDRFYKGSFLSFKEIEKAYRGMDGAFHDINHWATTYLDGSSNIEYIIGHQKNTTLDPVNKTMKTDISINKEAPHYPSWKNYVDICHECGRIPNVSVSFWATNSTMKASELPTTVNFSEHGYTNDDDVPCFTALGFQALSTVLQGACDDKDGCGIGIGMKKDIPIQPTGLNNDEHERKKLELLIEIEKQKTIKTMEEEKQ